MSTVEQLEDPQLIERGFLARIAQKGLAGDYTIFEGSCFTGSGMGPPRQEQAPMIGEHTRRFCVEDLGIDPKRVEELLASGAIEALDEPD